MEVHRSTLLLFFLVDFDCCLVCYSSYPFHILPSVCISTILNSFCSETATPNLAGIVIEVVIPQMLLKHVYGEDSSNLSDIARVGQFARGSFVSLLG